MKPSALCKSSSRRLGELDDHALEQRWIRIGSVGRRRIASEKERTSSEPSDVVRVWFGRNASPGGPSHCRAGSPIARRYRARHERSGAPDTMAPSSRHHRWRAGARHAPSPARRTSTPLAGPARHRGYSARLPPPLTIEWQCSPEGPSPRAPVRERVARAARALLSDRTARWQDMTCDPRMNGMGEGCGIDDCSAPPEPACIAGRCTAAPDIDNQ